ncbi:MAG TPA: metallophosphoesterase [Solirubrobacteraceae bacterium]|jgi:predicted phosphodiesterase|nr:metallophosphoesterase [Solirubrobacteraceae bacterium]
MRTLIVSDLHLGSVSGTDLLRRVELRAALLDAMADVDRVVLLGDALELRHGPMRAVMLASRPFFEDLGRALAGRELVMVAGNHDHALVEPWLSRRGSEHEPPALGVEQLLEPAEVSPALERIAGWAAPARVSVAYPGIWLRPDVYATHGHYLDCHLTVPTLERLSLGAMTRLLGRPASAFDCVGDYEATVAPVFAWRDAVARDAHTGPALNGAATVSAWQALRGESGRPIRGYTKALQRLRGAAIAAAFPVAISALNRAGVGPLRADISMTELRRAGLSAMGEVAARLQLGDAYVVFGHTHRAGPLPDDAQHEWRGRDGARLVNTGSWTYSSIFLTAKPGESPYWPGVCVLVDGDGPPTVKRLLQDRTYVQIASSTLP